MIAPFWLRFRENLSVTIRAKKETLTAFKKSKRAVIILNHPDRQDPFAIFKLADQLNELFYCIVARECFDWDGGWRGWLFQRLGCYSVARGKADFHSIGVTKKILLEGRRKLVVFPEAEITADYEELHHMQKAIFHIVLDSQQDLDEGKHENSDGPIFIIPAAIKFDLKDKLAEAVEPALANIEKHLGISAPEKPDSNNETTLARIDRVIYEYLSRVFRSYGLEKPEGTLDKLAEQAADSILRKIISTNRIAFDDKPSLIERLYSVRNHAEGDLEIDSVAIEPHSFHCAGVPKPSLRSDFERIERLLILERMLIHRETEIQNCRILDFIESEMTGLITPKGRQSCTISPCEPIDVSKFVGQYAESKTAAVNALREHCRKKLQEKLNEV
jgi:1-acyl-sn-glycerol-3-phosphate acyltransferase